jgi:hypothetical protein
MRGKRSSVAVKRWASTPLRSTSAARMACQSEGWAWQWGRTQTFLAKYATADQSFGRLHLPLPGHAPGADQLVHEIQVCQWVDKVATKPVWAKMTPNITDVKVPARAALANGMEGVSAINTIQSVIGVNLDTLRPEPCVEGHSTPGGYSCKAVKPIALAKCMNVAKLIEEEFGGLKGDRTLSGIGGVERGSDAAEFILLGASTVQVRCSQAVQACVSS